MEELNGVTIYWLISIGLFVGWVLDLILSKQSIGLITSLIFGAAGSVVIGVFMIILSVFNPLIYAAVGSVAFLFLINVFSFEPDKHEAARTSN